MVWKLRRKLDTLESRSCASLFRGVAASLYFDNSALQSDGDGVGPVIGVQFGEDVLDVALHGFFGERQLRGDLLVRIPAGDQSQYVDFSRGQSVIGGVLGDFGGNFRGQTFLAGMDRANRFEQFLAQQPFQQETPARRP